MTSREFQARLSRRAATAKISIPAEAVEQLEAYFRLLSLWNARINLTALPLERPTDATFDRLLIEPLAAARHIAASAISWFDIGSGGGSPAIPLKIVHPLARLTMIESKVRKAAFLREAVRALRLEEANVLDQRFEEVAVSTAPRSIDLATIRAVRPNRVLFSALHTVLSADGRAFLFGSTTAPIQIPDDFITVEVIPLASGSSSRVSILKPMFHVEQSG